MVAQKAGISGAWANRLATFRFAVTCFDWLENFSFIILTRIYPGKSIFMANLSSLFTVTKFLFVDVSAMVLAVLEMYILLKLRSSSGLTKSS